MNHSQRYRPFTGILYAILLGFIGAIPAGVFGKEKVAFVIGCDSYANTVKLDNAVSDAKDIASILSQLDFDVILLPDPGIEDFYQGLETFKQRAADAKVGLFYFAGHGIEVEQKNYLVPVDARLDQLSDLRTQAVNLSTVLQDMKEAGIDAKMLILDCCRDNPLTRSWMKTRSAGTGLAAIGDTELPSATLVMFAAAPGQPALDGIDGNSPFTKALVETLGKPGLSAFDTLLEVSDAVAIETGERQVPWIKFDGAGRTFRLFQFSSLDRPIVLPPSKPASMITRPVTETESTISTRQVVVPGKQFMHIRLGISKEEAKRLLGEPEKTASYNGGTMEFYTYYEKGLTLNIDDGWVTGLDITLVDRESFDPKTNKKTHRYSGPITFEDGAFDNTITFDEVRRRFGEPLRGNTPGSGEITELYYEGAAFYFGDTDRISDMRVFMNARDRARFKLQALNSDPVRKRQAEKLISLLLFEGYGPGVTVKEVVEAIGGRTLKTEEEDLISYTLFPEDDPDLAPGVQGLRILESKETGWNLYNIKKGKMNRYSVKSLSASRALKERGQPLLGYIGAKASQIEADLGPPIEDRHGNMQYQFSDGMNSGKVDYFCQNLSNGEKTCTSISVDWLIFD
ncbi:MAG: caspase family protein [Verrucomicrobiae bacterium]|nr:caspase family protein [Verrucomicrobiae bacterium]